MTSSSRRSRGRSFLRPRPAGGDLAGPEDFQNFGLGTLLKEFEVLFGLIQVRLGVGSILGFNVVHIFSFGSPYNLGKLQGAQTRSPLILVVVRRVPQWALVQDLE